MPKLSTVERLRRAEERLEKEKKARKRDRRNVKRRVKTALDAVDAAVHENLVALSRARAALALAYAHFDQPEAPGGDLWLSAEQACTVLGGISYQWFKEIEKNGQIPRGVILEGVDKVRRWYKLSWCLDYLEARYQEDPEAFALALLQRARRSEKQKRNAGEEPTEESEPGLMELTGSQVF